MEKVKRAAPAEVNECVGESYRCTLWSYNHRTNTLTLVFAVVGRNAQGESRSWTHEVGVSPETRREMGLTDLSQEQLIAAVAARWVIGSPPRAAAEGGE